MTLTPKHKIETSPPRERPPPHTAPNDNTLNSMDTACTNTHSHNHQPFASHPCKVCLCVCVLMQKETGWIPLEELAGFWDEM